MKRRPKSKPKKPNPFDWKNKPILEMTELELKRVDDEMALEEPILREARAGNGALLVAAAVLVLPNGEARLLQDGVEWGDGEGSKLVEHTVFIAKRALEPGEHVRLDLVEVQMSSDGTCSCSVSAGEGVEHEDVDDILAPHLTKYLEAARRRSETELADLWLEVLSMPDGTKRIACAERDDHDGRAHAAEFVLRARRMKWLHPGETIDRVRLKLRLSGTATWSALATLDPVGGRTAG